MERKRKGYLLRKSVTFNIPPQQKKSPPKLTCTCDNGSPAPYSRSYDLQTQTITFGEETNNNHTNFSNSTIVKKYSSSPPSENKNHQKTFDMDAELEFYPVDDHPSPSTFTAWDAFLSGNQAFFREPPSDFSYMDVIPEEEDDMEALLESDTDDTGSSVSTVVDRFSRTSTANSSFSERGPRTEAAPFDLQKVLSPFERLEKELDAHQGQREDDRSQRRNEIQRGPIVVITNSSSCEDVHSEPDEPEKSFIPTINKHDSSSQKRLTQEGKQHDSNHILEKTFSREEDSNTNSAKPSDTNSSSSVQSRIKIVNVNGIKAPEKPSAKKSKSDKIIPIIPPPSIQKKSYPTPNIPPRMSLHSPARRTRSDPGTPDTPSRIPRPISSSNRTTTSSPSSKNGPKALRSPKMNVSKKVASSETSKYNSSIPSETEENSKDSTPPSKLVDHSLDVTTSEVFDTCLD
ncbi:uncharacterized protein CDAR_515691 [Caerostris darwini]|uniref:Uncharacterized protein n=1 Tax=Caerostris darwini TaxID=1538125 RepID=A0AAV4S3S3_9ARAC|nr:uncharacterized protein CDAR_515691 [Caerostris darwini]